MQAAEPQDIAEVTGRIGKGESTKRGELGFKKKNREQAYKYIKRDPIDIKNGSNNRNV